MNTGSDGSLGSRAARLFVLLSGGVLAGMVQLAILPSLTQMAAHFSDQGDGAFIAQLVTTIAAPTMAFGAPLIGWLAGKVGKRPVLLVSAVVFALSGALGAFAPDLWTLLASRFLLGLAAAGLGTTAMAFIGDYFSGEARDRMIGWYATVGGGGSLITLIVAGGLAEAGGWKAPFALYLIGLLIFFVALPSIAEPKRAEGPAAAAGGSIRGAIPYCILIVLISISMYMVTLQGVFLLDQRGISSPSTQAIIMDVTTIGSMTGAYLFGYIRPKLGFHGVLALTWIVLGAGCIGFGASADVVAFAICGGLTGLGSGFMQPLTQSAVLNAVPPQAASRAIGLAIGGIFLGQLLNPFLLKPLRAAIGVEGTFLWVGAASLFAALVTMLWRMRGGLRAAPTS